MSIAGSFACAGKCILEGSSSSGSYSRGQNIYDPLSLLNPPGNDNATMSHSAHKKGGGEKRGTEEGQSGQFWANTCCEWRATVKSLSHFCR